MPVSSNLAQLGVEGLHSKRKPQTADTVVRWGAEVLYPFSKTAVCVAVSIPCERRTANAYDWWPILSLFSRTSFARPGRKDRLLSKLLNGFLVEEKSTFCRRMRLLRKSPQSGLGWEIWLLTVPFSPQCPQKSDSYLCVCVCVCMWKFLASVEPYGIRNVWENWSSYMPDMVERK